jgi:hypothetical protein
MLNSQIICMSIFPGAIDEVGDMPYYAEHCAAMLAVTYSSGQGMQRNIVRLINNLLHVFLLCQAF